MTENVSNRVTEDRLLGGRLTLRQPADGLRATIDPIFLAACVEARAGDRVLDLGTGSGVAALCLARRVPGCAVVGFDVQPPLVRLAAENIVLNRLESQVTVIEGDVAALPDSLDSGSFHHVMTNPPYIETGRGTPPPVASKAMAMAEGLSDLAIWVGTALTMVRPGGSVHFVHRADRLDAIIAALAGRAGEIVIFPLWPAAGKPAKRVLVRARRGIKTPLRLAAGLIIHEADGQFTAAAEAILRGGEKLVL